MINAVVALYLHIDTHDRIFLLSGYGFWIITWNKLAQRKRYRLRGWWIEMKLRTPPSWGYEFAMAVGHSAITDYGPG